MIQHPSSRKPGKLQPVRVRIHDPPTHQPVIRKDVARPQLLGSLDLELGLGNRVGTAPGALGPAANARELGVVGGL